MVEAIMDEYWKVQEFGVANYRRWGDNSQFIRATQGKLSGWSKSPVLSLDPGFVAFPWVCLPLLSLFRHLCPHKYPVHDDRTIAGKITFSVKQEEQAPACSGKGSAISIPCNSFLPHLPSLSRTSSLSFQVMFLCWICGWKPFLNPSWASCC